MRLALIGASGFVGKAVLNELLQRGHQVIAIVRHPENIKPQNDLTITKVDVTAIEALANVLRGSDAVVSAYNAGWTNPNLFADFLNGSEAIQTAVKKSGVRRLLVIGGAGSLFIDGEQLVDSPQFPEAYKQGAAAARDYLKKLQQEPDLSWTFLSPPIEMNPGTSGIRTGIFRTGKDNPVFNDAGRSLISVQDLAVAVSNELEQPRHIRERFTVAY
jgi:putative NADH-flavin reductase